MSRQPGHVVFQGNASSRGALLYSPASGTPCVHWRLKIVEQMDPSLQLVHEIASSEPFDVTWAGTGRSPLANGPRELPAADRPWLAPRGTDGALLAPAGEAMELAPTSVTVKLVPERACIQALPVLHRPGSPGARAVARQLQLEGELLVEEVLLRPGDEIVAEGMLENIQVGGSGPFRAVARELELSDATLRVPSRAPLAPVLLPWALGTAAALLGGVGAAAWAARRFDLLPGLRRGAIALPSEVGPLRVARKHFSIPE